MYTCTHVHMHTCTHAHMHTCTHVLILPAYFYNRESVASFLTRGDLWINWVWGKDTFEELMLDFEVTVSSGCWMKSSCSAFFTGPVEHFCPVTFGKQIDPTGIYIRTYCPELKNFPGTRNSILLAIVQNRLYSVIAIVQNRL